MLYGRDAELAAIEDLLGRARAGRSGTLVLRGEAGIGKSALLDHAAEAAGDMRVLRGTGVEYESGMPYAGLHLLLGRHLDRVGGLPDAQAEALRSALNMGGRLGAGDRFLVGLAVLTLLSDLAETPLLVLVDDAQWLDVPSAEALLFAARRLDAEPIAIVFAARDADVPEAGAPEFAAQGLAEVSVRALDGDAAAGLLDDRAAKLPRQVRQEVLAAAMGNPLALLELPGENGHGSAYERIRRAFAERIGALPEPARWLVLLVAADDLGDTGVVTRAGGRFGASVGDLEPAERHRLLRGTADGRLEVRHPLIRTAALGDATLTMRLAAHEALAAAYLERGDECHHAFHLARSVTGPDEHVAAVLEKTAVMERDTGGNASVAAMYEGAAALSPDRAERGRRLALAARACADAGLPERAIELAARAEADLPDPMARAELVLIRANLADEQDRTRDAYRLFAETAATVAELDPRTSGYLYFQAASAAANAADFTALDDIVAEGVRAGVPNAPHLRALSRVFAGQNPFGPNGDLADGVAALRELMDGMSPCYGAHDRVRAGMWHLMIGDVRGAAEAAAELERSFRAQGAIGLLAPALMLRSRTDLLLGRHRDALTGATEGVRIAADTGQHRIRVYLDTVLAQLAAIQGDEARCTELTEEALARGVPPGNVHAAAARSLLDLGLGRYEAALERLVDVVAGPNRQGGIAALPDLVEAAVRAGEPERARDAADWYSGWAAQIGQPWAEAVAMRCAALLAADPDDLYSRALELHREGGTPFEQARTELLYGEWLRRTRRRNDARARLHPALETFERLGAAPWADRVRTELRAAGESLADGTGPDDLAARLTPQELQVVRLAATGLSNREIGGQLFLSPRTVGYHLYKAYPKLGVAARAELARLDLS
ncbi:helix-turn-helix transcriptional regulator [Actinomadura darangshiensis]|uniref:Helix-turn-helix transcriptional regulator n=1 Tax=Actinomadura darangshiensis TaxID=705336 RepID=A0A4R4ZRA5_9ACTN|nr:LuxR family transcriptional regulator [Actinomadura darangshiensis]TDD60604.1 helix-turn-helix transcriptional regulator [Actinomadura darangshiensis]